MRKYVALIAMLLALLILTACGVQPPQESAAEPTQTIPEETGTEPEETAAPVLTEEQLQILAQRRDIAEAEMRRMMTVLWRSDVDITYSKSEASTGVLTDAMVNEGNILTILGGRVYSGLPYTHSSASGYSFDSYADFVDENGVINFIGMDARMLSGGGRYYEPNISRLGNDCADSVFWAWGKVASSVTYSYTKNMIKSNGCLPVGDYQVADMEYFATRDTCNSNGEQTMYAAYAQLQKADAVVQYNNSAGHAMMIVTVEVVKHGDLIDPERSFVTVLEQSSSTFKKEVSYFDENLGEEVYRIGGVDHQYTFQKLFSLGYLPVTCKELIDPSPLAEETVTDTEAEYTLDNIFAGTFISPYRIAYVTVTVTQEDGQVVQQSTAYGVEREKTRFDLSRFLNGTEQDVLKGILDLDALAPGVYRCTHTCRISTGSDIIVRDFEFTV